MKQEREHSVQVYSKSENGALIGVIGRTQNEIDYTLPPETIRHEEKKVLQKFFHMPLNRIAMLNQVHGDEIFEIAEYPANDLPWIADADGMITALPGICLVIRTADCVPVFAFDEERKVLGAVHAGWRGCQLNIAGKLLRTMKEMGCSPLNIMLYILPSIGPESYRVNEDVARFFPQETIKSDGRIFVDLWKSVERSAVDEGIPINKIFKSGECTFKNHNFFSHRRKDAGRNINFGLIKE